MPISIRFNLRIWRNLISLHWYYNKLHSNIFYVICECFFLASSKFPPISIHPAGIYLLKFKNWNHRTWCGICSKLTFKTPERRQWRRFGVFIVNFEHISRAALVFLLLTYSMQLPAGRCYEVLSLKKANHFYRNRGEMVHFKMKISLLQVEI